MIMKAIDDCQVVLFMLSDSSLNSIWTKREVCYAEGEKKRIVPILVDGENLRGWFKFHFGNVDYINIHSEEQTSKLINNLREWLGEKPKDRMFMVDGISFKMIRVEGGTFTMGATPEQGNDAFDDEKPPHIITISSFYLGETVVTNELWEAVMGIMPPGIKGYRHPVENVSWNNCQTFIHKLNEKTGMQFRLPTEAEWEYAARGGINGNNYMYAGSNVLDDVGWFFDNLKSTTHEVMCKLPNSLGLYDMSGNVWEWCADLYDKNYYRISPPLNPINNIQGDSHVYRGGCSADSAIRSRVSSRYTYIDNPVDEDDGLLDFVGFRLAL